jgi:putative ABC transport system permease protein
MRIPIVKGRDFTERDVSEAPHVAIVNEYMARRHWPGADPIGQRITSNPEKPDWYTVVGVIKDVKQANWSREKSEEMYFPYRQSPMYLKTASFASYMTLVVRVASTPIATTRAIESIVHGLDADVPVSDVITLEDALAEDLAEPRFYTWLLSAFAGVALVLAAVGIYGVMSHAVARRTHEIGIRMALGAARRDVFTIVVVQGLSLAALGGAIGLGGAFAVTRFLHTLLFGVEPLDPVTFAIVTALLAAVGVLACAVPARRASRVDPMVALRCE